MNICFLFLFISVYSQYCRNGYVYEYDSKIKKLMILKSIQQCHSNDNIQWEKIQKETIEITIQNIQEIKSFSFKQFVLLKQIVFNDNKLQSIGNYAFENCFSLKEISFPSSLISIGKNPFRGCSSLKRIHCEKNKHFKFINGMLMNNDRKEILSVITQNDTIVFPNEIQVIRESSLSNISTIHSIVVSSSLTIIEENAFEHCQNLNTIYVPEDFNQNIKGYSLRKATGICGKNLFYSLDMIKEILYIYESGEMDDYYLFSPPWTKSRENINKVVLLEGIQSIGNYSFEYFTQIHEIQIPHSVKRIGENAFQYCSSLKTVSLGREVKTIGRYAFQQCVSLGQLFIPQYVEFIGHSLFYNCHSLNQIIVEKENKYFISIDGVLFNSNQTTLLYYPSNKQNETYSIPSSVTILSDYSFLNVKKLKTIIIEGTIKYIGEYVFSDCSLLSTIIYHGKDIPIRCESSSFSNSSVSYIIVDFSYNFSSFCSQKIIKENIINDNTDNTQKDTSITKGSCGIECFYEFNISSFTLTISGNGEMNNYETNSVPWELFQQGIKFLYINEGIQTISSYAFVGCNSLVSVTIPSSVNFIGLHAFSSCKALETIIVDERNKIYSSLNGVLFNKNITALYQYPIGNKRPYYQVPSSVETISSWYTSI